MHLRATHKVLFSAGAPVPGRLGRRRPSVRAKASELTSALGRGLAVGWQRHLAARRRGRGGTAAPRRGATHRPMLVRLLLACALAPAAALWSAFPTEPTAAEAYEHAIERNRTLLQSFGTCPSAKQGAPPALHPGLARTELTSATRPVSAVVAQNFGDCETECETDLDCAEDEKCCNVGCMACAKAFLGPRYTPIGVGFVLMLLCGWAIACGTVVMTD